MKIYYPISWKCPKCGASGSGWHDARYESGKDLIKTTCKCCNYVERMYPQDRVLQDTEEAGRPGWILDR